MTTGLFPTPTRIRLLRLVRAGEVRWAPDLIAGGRAHDVIGGQTLTAQIREAQRAGWVTVPAGPGLVTLTDAGAVVLADDGRAR